MSENLIHVSVAQEIQALALLAEAECFDFQHHVLNSSSSFTGAGGFVTIFTIIVPSNSAFIMTSLDIKMLYATEDAALVGDFRSTFDLNPYGPLFTGSAGSGIIAIQDNGQQIFNTANDIGVMNVPLILVFTGGHTITIFANPQQPAGKTLVSINRVTGYLVPESIGSTLKKKESRIRTGALPVGTINL